MESIERPQFGGEEIEPLESWPKLVVGQEATFDIDIENSENEKVKEALYKIIESRLNETIKILGMDIDNNLIEKINNTENVKEKTKLQKEFIRSVARQINSIEDGKWAFYPAEIEKQKKINCSGSALLAGHVLARAGIETEYGNPVGHAINFSKLADGSLIYIDARNRLVKKIKAEEIEIEGQKIKKIDDKDIDYKLIPIFSNRDSIVSVLRNLESLKMSAKEGDAEAQKIYEDNRSIFDATNYLELSEKLYPEATALSQTEEWRQEESTVTEIQKQKVEEWKKNESKIDLDLLSFNFCPDSEADNYYDKKLEELEDKDRWIERNKNELLENKDRIAKAIENGLIADEKSETIWQFQIDRVKQEKEKIVQIKKELNEKIDQIKDGVVKKLSKLLPDWKPDKIIINFTINENADFCVDGDTITVDLERLSSEKDFLEKTVRGLTHEIFHVWMSEGNEWSDSKQDEVSDQVLKERIIFKTIDEGLAVGVSGQSLLEHHKQRDVNYDKYIQESFDAFNKFLKEIDREKLEKIKEKEFENMGHFYVVGNEIAKTILQNMGIEKFRKLVEECRKNPENFLKEYKSISLQSSELPKINYEI